MKPSNSWAYYGTTAVGNGRPPSSFYSVLGKVKLLSELSQEVLWVWSEAS